MKLLIFFPFLLVQARNPIFFSPILSYVWPEKPPLQEAGRFARLQPAKTRNMTQKRNQPKLTPEGTFRELQTRPHSHLLTRKDAPKNRQPVDPSLSGDPVRQDNDKIWILGSFCPPPFVVVLIRDFPYIFVHCFSFLSGPPQPVECYTISASAPRPL